MDDRNHSDLHNNHDHGNNYSTNDENKNKVQIERKVFLRKQTREFGTLKDPLLLQSVLLNHDFYALTWSALRKDIWEEVPDFRGQKIYMLPKNYYYLFAKFLGFIGLIILTLVILFVEVFSSTLYTEVEWPVFILRITLVFWAQRKLGPEFNQGIVLLRFAVKNETKFVYPGFAKFVAFCQFAIANINMLNIVMFICMEEDAMALLLEFAGLSIITCLDDWVGESIVCDKPHNECDSHPNEEYNTTDLNERMSLNAKMSYLEDYLEVIDDQNWEYSKSWFIKMFSCFLYNIPWFLLPLITIPIHYLNSWIHPHAELE